MHGPSNMVISKTMINHQNIGLTPHFLTNQYVESREHWRETHSYTQFTVAVGFSGVHVDFLTLKFWQSLLNRWMMGRFKNPITSLARRVSEVDWMATDSGQSCGFIHGHLLQNNVSDHMEQLPSKSKFSQAVYFTLLQALATSTDATQSNSTRKRGFAWTHQFQFDV